MVHERLFFCKEVCHAKTAGGRRLRQRRGLHKSGIQKARFPARHGRGGEAVTDQTQTPIAAALERMRRSGLIPFDVPGHKRGRESRGLARFFGRRCLSVDFNSMKPLDNLARPVSVIRDAEALAAEAFGARHAFFMVGGTTAAVQAMVLTACRQGDKLILPRNVHSSVVGALILCGAEPVYVKTRADRRFGIALGMAVEDLEVAIAKHPDAKAVFVNNPTYYGVCSNLREIAAVARRHGMLTLVDEAHGAHFYFGEGLPVPAMAAGADMAAVSMHKSGGSLTQSALLLTGGGVNPQAVRQVINLTQTTSASYLLLASLDIARRHLALNGRAVFGRARELAAFARREIGRIGGYDVFSRELVNGTTVFDFDELKLTINTLGIGLAGIEVYDILRDEYNIQVEFGDIGNILAYISVGDTMKNVRRLIGALADIKRRYQRPRAGLLETEYVEPEVVLSPQQAFYAERETVAIEKACGEISAETVMSYPPGIPILCPGERVTRRALDAILYARAKGCLLTGTEDPAVSYLNVVKGGV